jgi:SAM-dependent methyltransferase
MEYAQLGVHLWDSWGDEVLGFDNVEQQYRLRKEFRRDFGYVVASAEVMTALVVLLKDCGLVLDAGCGSGYMAAELTRLGIPTLAVDHHDYGQAGAQSHGYPIRAVHKLDAVGNPASFISSEVGAVLLAWPPYDEPFALNMARAMQAGQLLVYEGESAGGCTANDAFFEFVGDATKWESLDPVSAQLNAVHVTFGMLHDHWIVWRRLG